MNIYEIAQIANVSPSAVSMVINGKAGIGKETRDKILKIIKDNDFTPKISRNKPNNIAIPYRSTENFFDSEFSRKILKGIADDLVGKDFNILLLPIIKIPKDKGNFKVFCYEQRIMGCIFLELKSDDYFVTDISGIVPIVTIDAKFKGDKIYSINSDDYHGAYQAMKLLYNNGHRKIALVSLDLLFQAHKARYDAYLDALEKFQIPFDKEYIISLPETDFSGFRYLIEHFEKLDKLPTAFLVMNDQEAIRIISYLNELGKQVPDDISVIGFDDYDFDNHVMPSLTTVRQELFEMGKKAINLVLDNVLKKKEYIINDAIFIFPTNIVQRRSVKIISTEE